MYAATTANATPMTEIPKLIMAAFSMSVLLSAFRVLFFVFFVLLVVV
jgi:hypothetical protein